MLGLQARPAPSFARSTRVQLWRHGDTFCVDFFVKSQSEPLNFCLQSSQGPWQKGSVIRQLCSIDTAIVWKLVKYR